MNYDSLQNQEVDFPKTKQTKGRSKRSNDNRTGTETFYFTRIPKDYFYLKRNKDFYDI